MPRVGLTREAIVDAAIARADEHGLASVTMRALAGDLDVEAMSLYNHVANKRAVLEAISDRVWAATDLAVDESNWRAALHAMCGSAHQAMSAHPWFFELPVTSFGLARVRMIEQTLRRLSEAGLRDESVYHAHHVLDGHMFGYTLQEVQFSATPEVEERGTEMLNSIDPAEFTNLMVHVQQHIDPPEGDGFTFGLDMILDGLERLVQSQQGSSDMYVYQVVSTPDGPFTVIENNGVVVGAGWSDSVGEVATRAGIAPDAVVTGACASANAVLAFYEGDTEAVASVAVAPHGTEFRERVWEVLRTIPAGETRTYGEVAALLGTPSASRAVGAACGANVTALFVPCHRVVGASGTLTGFAWGVETKKSLLTREGSLALV